jgi:NAD(P)-dependent dehydrogenase (short-subunit alcohol dehydrogenase family)
MRLAGKIAVVTGASRGIGRAIAAALAREGAEVAGCSLRGRSPDGGGGGFLDDLAGAAAGRSFLVPCDVRDAGAVAAFRDQVLARLGAPDILVNNAGTVARAPLAALTEAQWHDVLGSNLTGTFLITRAFVGELRGRRGRIINISSIAGRQGTPQLSAYNAAKHGVVGLTRAWAEELRPDGITVNAICPGSVDTDMLKIGMPGGTANMTPGDVARVAVFLAADAPVALNGACIDVFG